jgi:hypothetical protein
LLERLQGVERHVAIKKPIQRRVTLDAGFR